MNHRKIIYKMWLTPFKGFSVQALQQISSKSKIVRRAFCTFVFYIDYVWCCAPTWEKRIYIYANAYIVGVFFFEINE